jgi:hypothetical protein
MGRLVSLENRYAVIRRDISLKDLARAATIVVRMHIRRALDPSQAQDDPIMRR